MTNHQLFLLHFFIILSLITSALSWNCFHKQRLHCPQRHKISFSNGIAKNVPTVKPTPTVQRMPILLKSKQKDENSDDSGLANNIHEDRGSNNDGFIHSGESDVANKSDAYSEMETEIENIRNDLQETLSGGPSMIFAMARRMLVWDDEDYQASTMGKVLNDASPMSKNITQTQIPTVRAKQSKQVLPRWHPVTGIADANPNFRNSPPVMNNNGYAGLIKRNSRKKNHPSLWRHSYRVYDKMRSIELQQSNASSVSSSSTSNLIIQRENPHFEAALNSCAKLGLWRESISIYKEMQDIYKQQQLELRLKNSAQQSSSSSNMSPPLPSSSSTNKNSLSPVYRRKRKAIKINEYMILSIVKACVRGMKYRVKDKERQNYDLNKKREPLDAAMIILQHSLEKHSIKPRTIHVNSLAAGYQFLGLFEEAEKVFDFLDNERHGKLNDNDNDHDNISTYVASEIESKDEGSYSILVKNAVTQGDWSSAIENLKEMTNNGHYPKARSLNSWSETANKRERRPRRTTWVKKRERMLMKSALYDGRGSQSRNSTNSAGETSVPSSDSESDQ